MPDPLAQVAAELAPRPTNGTNYLDPAAGRDVIARYGQSRMLGDSLEGALRLDNLATRSRLDRARAAEYEAGAGLRARERDLRFDELDAREQELADEREARGMRGKLLSEIWSLNRDDPDYRQQVEGIMRTLPDSVRQDAGIKDALDYHMGNLKEQDMLDREAERYRLMAESAQAKSDARYEARVKEAGIGAERYKELRDQFTNPDGTIDNEGLSYELGRAAAEAKSGRKVDEAQAKADILQEDRMELMGVKQDAEAQKAQEEKALAELDAVPDAFPTQTGSVIRSWAAEELGLDRVATNEELAALLTDNFPNQSMEDIEDKVAKAKPVDYAAAQEFDKNREAREAEAARSRSMQEYVDLVPGLDERGQQARRNFWRAATKKWNTPAPETAEAPVGDEVAPDAVTPKQLTDEIMADYMARANYDPVKAAELAEADGYEP